MGNLILLLVLLLLHPLHGEALVAKELGAHALGGHLSTGSSPLDTVPVSLADLVVVGVVLGL